MRVRAKVGDREGWREWTDVEELRSSSHGVFVGHVFFVGRNAHGKRVRVWLSPRVKWLAEEPDEADATP